MTEPSQPTEPGWYPDPDAPTRERHWDGERWNAYRPRDANTPALPPRTRRTGDGWLQSLSTRELQAMVVVFVVVALLLLGAIVLSAGSDQDTPPAPTSQQRFERAVRVAAQETEDAPNDIAKVLARKKRARAICRALPDGSIARHWVGTIDSIGTEGGSDDGTASVKVGKQITLTTRSTDLLTSGEDTLIPPTSQVYATLGTLDEGDPVVFSGRFLQGDGCVKERSVFQRNAMRSPTFLFRFTKVAKG